MTRGWDEGCRSRNIWLWVLANIKGNKKGCCTKQQARDVHMYLWKKELEYTTGRKETTTTKMRMMTTMLMTRQMFSNNRTGIWYQYQALLWKQTDIETEQLRPSAISPLVDSGITRLEDRINIVHHRKVWRKLRAFEEAAMLYHYVALWNQVYWQPCNSETGKEIILKRTSQDSH